MRIAYLAESRTGNAFYRGIAPMTALQRDRGHDVRKLSEDGDRPPLAAVRDVDVLHMHRFGDDRAVLLAREAKAHGAAVVWDNDDDMGSVPKNTIGYRRQGGMMWERRLAGIKKIFRVADLATAPCGPLAGRLQEYGAAHTAVIENYLPDQFLQRGQPARDGVTIGWIAGLEHQLDVDRIPIRDVLQRLLDERGDVRVVTFGLGLGLRSERYTHVDVVPLMELTREATAFDVGIAPLSDIAMNRARSNIKLKEYGAAGAAWLASPIGPYAGLGEQQGGRLVADDQWHDALTRLLDKPRERGKLAKRARKWAAGETLSKHARTWEARFEEAIARARSSARAGAT